MRNSFFALSMLGFGACFALAAACSDFNGVASPDAAVADANVEAADGVPGTPGDDSSVDGASSWTPKDLSGLTVWLDSSIGVFADDAGAISSWKDQSGQANNGAVLDPCYDTDRASVLCRGPVREPASLNGHDTVRFDLQGKSSSYISITDSPGVQFGTGDFAVFVVARYSNGVGGASPANVGYLWTKGTVDNAMLQGLQLAANTSTSAILSVGEGDSVGEKYAFGATPGLNDNAFRRYGAVRRNMQSEAWVNGVLDGKATLTTVHDVSELGYAVNVGGPPSTFGGGLIGNIAEVVTVKSTITDADIAKLDAYFKTKWGL